MTIHDISLVLDSRLPIWPGDPPLELARARDIDKGSNANVSHITASVHMGTHVDAPLHFIQGSGGIETLDLDTLIGPALVVEALEADIVNAPLLDSLSIPSETVRLLMKTRNSALWERGETQFQADFVAVDVSGAEWMIDHGIQLIGVDYISVAPFQNTKPTHLTLLEANVIPVEGLNLSQIEPGDYNLVCLPINLGDCDGAPARVVLIDQ